MAWPTPAQPTPPNAVHFTGFSAGSYTAIALEAEYRLLSQRLRQPLCAGCATLGALGCPIIYPLALLQPDYCAGDHQLVSNERTVRIIHLWDDQLCPWNPSLTGLQAITTSVHPTLPTPSLLIQVLDTGTGPRRPKCRRGHCQRNRFLGRFSDPILGHHLGLAFQHSYWKLTSFFKSTLRRKS